MNNNVSSYSPQSSSIKNIDLNEMKTQLDQIYNKFYSIPLNKHMNYNVIGNDPKNLIIIFLLILLILTFFGINILGVSANIVKITYYYFAVIFGSLMNEISTMFSNILKTIIDILDGIIKTIGNMLISSSNLNNTTLNTSFPKLDLSINNNDRQQLNEPKEDTTENPIQNPISSNKNNWCLIGEYQNKRGCVEVSQNYKCMSGQLYSTKQECEKI